MRQAIELARLSGILPLVLMYTAALMEILIERDELDAAEAALQAIGMATAPMPVNAIFSMLLLIRGHLRFEQGKFEQAAEDFVTLWEQAEGMGLGAAPALSASPFAARALIAIGKPEQARKLAEDMLVHAKRWGAPSTVAHALRAVAMTRGGEAGIELFAEAAAMLEDSPRRLERGHALVDLGTALRRENRRGEARVPLREALELARRCGAARIARRANEELQATGEKVRRYTPIGVESLTPSERRVAELAASGMTNRQIAQMLLSPSRPSRPTSAPATTNSASARANNSAPRSETPEPLLTDEAVEQMSHDPVFVVGANDLGCAFAGLVVLTSERQHTRRRYVGATSAVAVARP